MITAQVRELFLYDIMIAEAFQRQGIGKELIKKILDIAKSRGASAVYVATETDNMGAQHLYERTGAQLENVCWYVYTV